jgi:hypothetical protein
VLAQAAAQAISQDAGQSTAGDGWVLLTGSNPQLGFRYIEIMCRMNRPSYATDRPQVIVRRMAQLPCEYYYYAGSDFEVVCGFKWIRRSRRYRLMSVGFVGAITPSAALEIVVQKVRDFLQQKQIHYLIAIRPAVMENPTILEFYELFFRHPGLAIRGTHPIEGGTYLWLGLPEPD